MNPEPLACLSDDSEVLKSASSDLLTAPIEYRRKAFLFLYLCDRQ